MVDIEVVAAGALMNDPVSFAVRFPSICQFLSCRLGTALPPRKLGGVNLVETPLRLRRELSFGYVRALWWLRFGDGSSILSVPPGAAEAFGLAGAHLEQLAFGQESAGSLAQAIRPVLRAAGLAPVDRVFHDVLHACSRSTFRPHPAASVQRLRSDQVPPAEGLCLPTQCFPDGIAYGATEDGRVVSCAYAHRAGVLEDRVADLGVETAPAYRRHGYGTAVVSAVVAHVLASGGEAHYAASPENHASLATAAAMGFVRYAESLILGAPANALAQ